MEYNTYSELLQNLNISVEQIEKEFQRLSKKIGDTQFISSGSEESIKIIKKYNKLKEILEIIEEIKQRYSQIEKNKDLLTIAEFKNLAEEENKENIAKIDKLTNKLKLLTTPPLKNDELKSLVEIRPGVGGNEASLFAEDLYKMYVKYLSSKNWKIEIYSINYNEEGGITEVIFLVDEPDSFGHLRFESGVHRVQRIPVTESSGRIHTSSASVVVMPQILKPEIQINPEDLKVDVFRSSGPGGQSVNTTDSAVRITHIPTGIVVNCQNGKSQHKNKEIAMSILISKLEDIENKKFQSKTANIRSKAIKSGDRSVKIRTYNFPKGRVTDHRLPKTWHNIEAILNGDIEEMVTTVNQFLRSQ
jgi:peptide chain release factor 1